MNPVNSSPSLLDRLLKLLDRLAIGLRLFLLLLLALVTLGLAGFATWNLIRLNTVHHLTFAVGDPLSESYVMGQAIQQVVEAYHPNLQIEVVTTAGSADNLKRLAQNQVQLVTAQADVPAGMTAKSVALLYSDLLQLVVKEQSGIAQFSDLRGKRIGIQPSGGQFYSFMEVAQHYGLSAADFQFIAMTDDEAGAAFQESRIDAVFRVRAAGNLGILDLVGRQGQLLPIEQAEAMKIKYPAFTPAVIPRGAYRGSLPVVPSQDIATVAIPKLLLASAQVEDALIREIAAILNEHRQEIANAIPDRWAEVRPLVSNIARPASDALPLHPGALAYYDRNKPSFFRKNADYFTFSLTLALLAGSWIWELKSWAEARRKGLADTYIDRVIELMGNGQAALSPSNLLSTPEQRREALYGLFDEAADRLVAEEISQESFRTFNEAYKTAREKIEREIEAITQQAQAQQQQKTLSQIDALGTLLQTAATKSPDAVQTELSQIYQQTLNALLAGDISQESFRTFTEVYNSATARIGRY